MQLLADIFLKSGKHNILLCLVGVCGIPKYGSESEFQKPNRTELFLEFRKDGIQTFSEFRHLLCETDYLASSLEYSFQTINLSR